MNHRKKVCRFPVKLCEIVIVVLICVGLFSISDARASDVALLYDVSKSMLPSWYSSTVRNDMASLIVGDGISTTRWQVSATAQGETKIVAAIQGQSSLLEPGDRLLIIAFGEMRTPAAFPYFNVVNVTVTDMQQARKTMLNGMPFNPTDKWTNKLLSAAVASKIFTDGGSREWYVVMVSDFNQDYPSPLSQEMEELIDRYEVNSDYSKEGRLVLRLSDDHRLQVRVYRVVYKSAVPSPQPVAEGTIVCLSPTRASKVKTGSPVRFSWSCRGLSSGAPDAYSLNVVRGETSTRPVLTRHVKSNSFTYQDGLDAGTYNWWVTAFMAGGQLSSQKVTFRVTGGSPWFIIILILLAVGVFVLSKILSQRKRRKEHA